MARVRGQQEVVSDVRAQPDVLVHAVRWTQQLRAFPILVKMVLSARQQEVAPTTNVTAPSHMSDTHVSTISTICTSFTTVNVISCLTY